MSAEKPIASFIHLHCDTLPDWDPRNTVQKHSNISPLIYTQCFNDDIVLHWLTATLKTSLTQGRHTWPHNKVLKCLTAQTECNRASITAMPLNNQAVIPQPPAFIHRIRPHLLSLGCLSTARDWKQWTLARDFPFEITSTTLWPDLNLWSNRCRNIFIFEWTVPWQDSAEEVYKCNNLWSVLQPSSWSREPRLHWRFSRAQWPPSFLKQVFVSFLQTVGQESQNLHTVSNTQIHNQHKKALIMFPSRFGG